MPARSRVRSGALIASALFTLTAPVGGAASPATLDALLARARRSIGHDGQTPPGPLRMHGSSIYLGRAGRAEIVLAADGRFVRRHDATIADAAGWNGAELWTSDWKGMPRILESAERDWIATWMSVVQGTWTRPAANVTLALDTAAGSADTATVVLRFAGHPVEFVLTVDAETGLVHSMSRKNMSGAQVARFSGWRAFEGVRLPMRIEEELAGTTNVFAFEGVERIRDAEASRFAVPPPPGDSRFLAGVPAALELKRAASGHVLVRPRIDGQDIGWFIFDTGAGSASIAPATAAALGLPVVAETGIMSIFGLAPAPVRQAGTLTLGPLELTAPTFVEFDLSPYEAAFGEKIAGIVGYDVLRRAIVEVELATNRISLFDPGTYDGAGRPWQPLHFQDRHALIEASFESHEGLFKLDVGASGGPFSNVALHAPAVKRLNLLEGRETQKAHIGHGEVAIGKLAWFELAGHRFESPTVVFTLGEQNGPFQDAIALGNIGVAFMDPFVMVFDYAQRRIAMVNRAQG